MAEEKAYFKLLRDIYEINVSWPHREEGEIKQASNIWSRTPPPWIGKLSLAVTGSSGRVRAGFNFVSCKNSPLWETTDGASHTGLGIWLGPSLKVELRRQQPAENSSAAAPRWTLANALVPFMAQWACGFYSAEATSQVSWFIGIILSVFVESCFWSYLSCWQHLLSPCKDEIQSTSGPRLDWWLYTSKLVPVPAGARRAGENQSCPLRISPWLHVQSVERCYRDVWPALGHTGGSCQPVESELDHWWLVLLFPCWHILLLPTSAFATDVGI